MAKRGTHFTAVFLCTVLFTIVLMGGTAFVVYNQYLQNEASSTETSEPGDILFEPDASQSQTLLLILEGGPAPTDDAFVVARFQPVDGKLVLLPLLGQTACQINTSKSTLYEFYRIGGAMKAVEAVENILNIRVEKYILFDKDDFNSVVDILGGVNYSIPYDMAYEKEDTGETVILREGRQYLDGTKLRWLITFPEYSGGEEYRLQLIGSVLTDMLNGALSNRMANTLDNSFNTIVNQVETNITAYDYQFRKEAILYLIQPGTTPVQFKLCTGTFDKDGEFTPDKTVRDNVLHWFGTEALVEMQ